MDSGTIEHNSLESQNRPMVYHNLRIKRAQYNSYVLSYIEQMYIYVHSCDLFSFSYFVPPCLTKLHAQFKYRHSTFLQTFLRDLGKTFTHRDTSFHPFTSKTILRFILELNLMFFDM